MQEHKRTKCLCSQSVHLNPQDNAATKSFTIIAEKEVNTVSEEVALSARGLALNLLELKVPSQCPWSYFFLNSLGQWIKTGCKHLEII